MHLCFLVAAGEGYATKTIKQMAHYNETEKHYMIKNVVMQKKRNQSEKKQNNNKKVKGSNKKGSKQAFQEIDPKALEPINYIS